ncbi:MAG: KEOPS complex subunit Pcc1, partial [Thermoplasmata archaeon]
PESSREVPRATARVDRVGPDTVRLTLTARDTGALRAALNTYLGWISLADRTDEVGRAALRPPVPPE